MDDSRDISINRSFSLSEPNLNVAHYRQIIITEVQSPNHKGQLLRHCSYQELSSPCPANKQGGFYNNFFSPDATMNEFNNTLTFEDSNYGNMYENKLNYSPMDVDEDLSDHFQTDIEDNTNFDQRKKLCIKKSEVKCPEETDFLQEPTNVIRRKDSSGNIKFKSALVCVIIAIFASIFFYESSKSLKEIPVSEIELYLRSSIANQDHVIDSIVNNLNIVTSDIRGFRKVLALAGGTGVGKSFVLKQMRKKYSTDAYVSLTYTVHRSLIEKVTNTSFPSDCFLLSIDDLRLNHIEIVSTFIQSIDHSCVLIIPVFNLQDTKDMKKHTVSNEEELRVYLKGKFPNSETVLFNSMNKGDLEVYLNKMLDERGLSVTEHRRFVNSMLAHHDVESFGFKGVLPKIDLLN